MRLVEWKKHRRCNQLLVAAVLLFVLAVSTRAEWIPIESCTTIDRPGSTFIAHIASDSRGLPWGHGKGMAMFYTEPASDIILSPIWQRGWFLILAACLIAAGVFAFDHYRVNQLKRLRAALSVSEKLTEELTEQRGELGKANRTLAIDYAVTSALAESATPTEAAPRILQTICVSTGWEIGAIWDVDRQAGALRCVDVWHLQEFNAAEFEALTRDYVFLPGIGLPGRVLASREPHWIADLARDDNFPRLAIAAKEGLQSGFGFPILLGNEVIGVLEFFSREVRKPDPDEIAMMSSIGSHIGQLIKRKRAEDALRESEEKYRTILENIQESYYEVDLAGSFVFFNDALCEILGYSRDELTGLNYRHYTDQETALEVYLAFNNVYTGGEAARTYEYEIIRKDGSRRYIETSISLITDPKNKSVGFRGIIRDITERKLSDEMRYWKARFSLLRAEVGYAMASNDELREVLQRCSEAIVRNLDGAFARIWLLNREDNVLEMQASAGMYTHIDGAHSRVPVGKLKIGYIAETRLPLLTNDVINDPHISDKKWAERERMVAFAGYPLLVGSHLVGVMAMFARRQLSRNALDALGSVADIIAQGVERKRAEEALRKSREDRLMELERVRTRIATDLHDDIGSSLTQIAILSEVAQRFSDAKNKPTEIDPFAQLTQISNDLVEAMSDIVWAINPMKDHLSDLVQRMRRFTSDIFSARRIDFSFYGPDEAEDIQLGANMRREVFLVFKESVNNIVKHSGCARAEIEFSIEGGWLRLRVSDDGCGFDSRIADCKIPSNLPGNGEGHGLLSMRRRAEDLGGAIEIVSQNGQGTTVALRVPIARKHTGE